MCQSQTLKLLVLALLFLRVVRKHPANTMRKTTRRSLLPSQRAFAKVVAPETLGRVLDTRAEAHSFNSLRSPTGGQQTELKGYRSLQKSCNARIRPGAYCVFWIASKLPSGACDLEATHPRRGAVKTGLVPFCWLF